MDSCAGQLAEQLAANRGIYPTTFDAYYQVHRARTITPLFTMAGTSIGATINWHAVFTSVLARQRLRTYLSSGHATCDDEQIRWPICGASW